MKKSLFIFSIFFLCLFVSSFLIPFLIKDEKIIQFVKKEISKRIEGELTFDSEIKIHLFPNPSISIKNLKFTNDSFLEMEAIKMNISSDWISLLSKKPKLNKVELFSPKLEINSNFFFLTNNNNEYFRKANYKSSSENINEYLEWLNSLQIYNGSLEMRIDNQLHKLNDIKIKFLNMKKKKVEGDFVYDNFLSKYSFNLFYEDIRKIKTRVKHNFVDGKSVSFMEGFIYPLKKPILFEGSLNSELIDFEEFVNFKNKFSNLKNQSSVYRVSDKNDNFSPISLKVNTDIKKLKYNNHLLENIKYQLLLEEETLKIENFKANYLNSSVDLNAVYNLDSKMIKGLLLINNLGISREIFGKTKYDIFGGNGNLTAKFRSSFKNESLQEIIDDTYIEGKFFSKDSTFKGLDTRKISKKIDSLKQISDFFSLIKLFDAEGLSIINEINGDFLFNKGILRFIDILIMNENFKITSSGNYKFSENYFDIRNTIKLKTNEYTKLPDFQFSISGTPEKYSTNLDMEEIKKFFLTDEILKLGPIKSLKIPMKKNNSIDLEEIFKLF